MDVFRGLESATVMPGLMDMHVHISSQQSGAAGYAERFFLNPAYVTLRATNYASRTLLAGFTTVSPVRCKSARTAAALRAQPFPRREFPPRRSSAISSPVQ